MNTKDLIDFISKKMKEKPVFLCLEIVNLR